MAGKIIFITGVSSGLGQGLAEEALTQGWRVLGTVRSEEARKSFEAKASGRAIGRVLDVTGSARIPQVIAEVEENIGAIDVLVNNAGYGVEAPVCLQLDWDSEIVVGHQFLFCHGQFFALRFADFRISEI
jgi:NAD(P)-dependent dehydrogenase (short-subunit alcohol dehydrogenase family)